MDRWEIEKKVVMKALKDPAFKKELISNPKKALKGFCKEADLEHAKIKIYEEKQNEWIFSIPHIEAHGKKMSDQELEKLFAACSLFSGCGLGSH